MQLPLTIGWRNLKPDEDIERDVRAQAERLERVSQHLTSCRVVVEVPHRRRRNGRLFHVRIDLTVPEAEIAVRRDPPAHQAHQDPHVAVRDAFRAARSSLQEWESRRRHRTKTHAPSLAEGMVDAVLPDLGFGFIRVPDGAPTVYFHRNALEDLDLDALEPGTIVRFASELGDAGPQAIVVRRREHLH
ncbi:MAG: HPF/RaiA family ribosome-associated protein [Deltaproteobacteria bacterium]|nr:MAG: HPF/RaiA family ribosome-associated protein [Deltaproteobacteria bacterium]